MLYQTIYNKNFFYSKNFNCCIDISTEYAENFISSNSYIIRVPKYSLPESKCFAVFRNVRRSKNNQVYLKFTNTLNIYRSTHTNYANLSIKNTFSVTSSRKIIHFPYKLLLALSYNNKHPDMLHMCLEQYYRKRSIATKSQYVILRKYEDVKLSHIIKLKSHNIDFLKVYKKLSVGFISVAFLNQFYSHIHCWLGTYNISYSHVKSDYGNLNNLFRHAVKELNTKDIVVIVGKYMMKNRILKYFLALFENLTLKKIRISLNNTIVVGINNIGKSILLIFNCDIESSIIGWYCFLEPYIRDVLKIQRKKECFSILLNNFNNFTGSSCVLKGKTYLSKNNKLVTVILKNQNFNFLDSLINYNSLITFTPDKKIYKKGELIKIFII